MRVRLLAALSAFIVLSPAASIAQSPQAQAARPQTAPSGGVPRLITVGGVFKPVDGQPVNGVETVTFAIYADEAGGPALWQETQNVQTDATGRYSVLLGATRSDGVPMEVFASGEARWLGMTWARSGEVESRRSRLTFVPYAVRAADADTLGGRPASDYALSAEASGPKPTGAAADEPAASASANSPAPYAILPGSANYLAKYVNGSDIGTSATVYDAGGRIGFNTIAPADVLHAQFTNNDGSITGLAVQNLGGTSASYSGMLFLDQTGAVANFQGFNNSTHEYRINNVAKNVSSQFNGSINFMVGGASRLFITSGSFVGIGTASPSNNLEVSNGTTVATSTVISSTTYSNSGVGGGFIGRKARGTFGAPTAVQGGDTLASFLGIGYGSTAFSSTRGGMFVRAAENWTDAAQGTVLAFNVTPTGTTGPSTAMLLNASGHLGIGTTNPNSEIHIVKNGDAAIVMESYGANGLDGPASGVFVASSRGTSTVPAALLAGDSQGYLASGGYDGSDFYGPGGFVGFVAAENWTATAHGTAVGLGTTPIGGVEPLVNLAVLANGNVGIGTTPDGLGIPTAADKLQVAGDIRVGTSGTNGCLKDFGGGTIIGTCSSDLRLKKDVTPFGRVLDKLTVLQPVHYFWRAVEFPDRHFGTEQTAGLIAQDVEQVLPELVVTQSDGFKAVNYSKLPLLTIQAVKELKAENDTLKQRVDELEPLKQRVAELERRLAEALAALGRR